MKKRCFILGIIALITSCIANAQTNAGLAIQTYAGLTITGVVGRVYTIQFLADLPETNNWRAVGIVQLPSSPYLWVDKSAPLSGRRFYRTVEGPSNLTWIPPGTFTMGSPSNELERTALEGPQTVVTLTDGFFLGKFEVTEGEYFQVMSNNPAIGGGPAHPVNRVKFAEALEYCNRMVLRERAAGRLPEDWTYRLPTEAEWEYACRAGTTTAFSHGHALRSGAANFNGTKEYDSGVGTVVNPIGIFIQQTTPVGSYAPNAWGLYDMHGNVSELCADWFGAYPGGRVTNWAGVLSGTGRVVRGGSWDEYAEGEKLRSASRNYTEPDAQQDDNGFRVVVSPLP